MANQNFYNTGLGAFINRNIPVHRLISIEPTGKEKVAGTPRQVLNLTSSIKELFRLGLSSLTPYRVWRRRSAREILSLAWLAQVMLVRQP
jgi:hypothetical protein